MDASVKVAGTLKSQTKTGVKSGVSIKTVYAWAVVVVKWSAYMPSIPTIRIRILLMPTVFFIKFVFEKERKEADFLK